MNNEKLIPKPSQKSITILDFMYIINSRVSTSGQLRSLDGKIPDYDGYWRTKTSVWDVCAQV